MSKNRTGGGRQRNAAATKQAIFEAATQAFARTGYQGAGLREIASDAGVDVALISRYFGSKEKLFEQVLEEHLFIDNLIAGGRENFGQHVMHRLIDESGETFNSLPLLITSAQVPSIASLCVAMLERRFVQPLGAWLGGSDGEQRATRILMLLTGFTAYWNVLPLSTAMPPDDGSTRVWMEETLQMLVDGASAGKGYRVAAAAPCPGDRRQAVGR